MRETYFIVVLFLIIQRILELKISKANKAKLVANGFECVEEKKDLFLMIALHTAWFIGLIIEPLFIKREVSQSIFSFALIILFLAQGLRYWAIKTLGDHWNISIMAPKTDKRESFVASGPYRYIRHPNYLAVMLEFISVPLIGGAYITLILGVILNFLVLKKRISVEDKFLFSRQGYRESFSNKVAG